MKTLSISLTSLPQLFLDGGLVTMSILTVILVGLLFAAWKAPAWLKEIGIAALVVSLISIAHGWYRGASAVVECHGNISPALLWGGLKCCMVTLIYGLIIYLISLVIRLIRKPRI